MTTKTKTKDPWARWFGNALRTERVAKGMSQEDLALGSGLCQADISYYECHNWLPKGRKLFKIFRALGMHPSDFFERHWPNAPAD